MSHPTETQALELIEKYSTATKQHLLQVGAIMKYFAEKLGEDAHYWWLVGALHDIDRDHIEKNGDKHLKDDFEKIMAEIDAPVELLADIRSHGHFLPGITEEPDTLVRKYINAVDELSGFIWAYFRMLPSEDVMDIKPKSIKKKLKDKAFASGVDRGEARNCESMLGLEIDDFIEDIKLALKGGRGVSNMTKKKIYALWFSFFIIILILIGGFFLQKQSAPSVLKQEVTAINNQIPEETIQQPQLEMIVVYTDEWYAPQYFNIKKWTSVTFVNNSSIPMWTASGPHPVHTDYPEFDAKKEYLTGEEFTFIFDKSWTHAFHNHMKSLHNGVIRVSDGELDLVDISKTLPESLIIRDELLQLLKPWQPDSIRDLFERIRNDKKLANNCHDMAHDLWHRAYELYGLSTALTFQDLESVPINDIDDLCAWGYMHGVLEEYFLYNPEIIHTPEKVCVGIPEENQGSCYHWVGHWVMFSVDRNRKEAAEICQKIESFEPEHRCYEGVYMEFFWWDTGHVDGFLWWDIEDPLSVCANAPFDEQAACYLYSHLGYLRTHKHDYNWAMNLCIDTQGIDDYGLSFCIKGIGITTMKSFERAWLHYTENYTTRLDNKQKWYYYQGVIWYAFLSWKTRSEILNVCKKMKRDKNICEVTLNNTKK